MTVKENSEVPDRQIIRNLRIQNLMASFSHTTSVNQLPPLPQMTPTESKLGYKDFARILRAANNSDFTRDLHQAKAQNTLTRYCSDAKMGKLAKKKYELKKEVIIGHKLLKK